MHNHDLEEADPTIYHTPERSASMLEPMQSSSNIDAECLKNHSAVAGVF